MSNNLSLESCCDLSSEGQESASDTASKVSGSSSRSTNQKPAKNRKHESHQGVEIAQAETQMLFFSKASVFAVLLLAAAGCAVATYLFTHRGEDQDFEDEVADFATEIFEVSQITARSIVDTISAMSVTITSYALDQKADWPFVTIPDFERRGNQVLKLSGAKYLAFCPLVNETNLATWEQWSVENQDWIPEVEEARSTGGNSSLITPFIFHFAEDGVTVQREDIAEDHHLQGPSEEEEEEEEGEEDSDDVAIFDEPHLAPFWQVAPTLPGLVNFNSFSHNELFIILDEVFKTRAARFSELLIDEKADPNDDGTWPSSYLVAPVYASFDEEESETPVALLEATVPWHNFFKNLLPEGTPGVFLVLTNTCGQEVTYQVNGPSVEYVGNGDLHDRAYASLQQAAHFNALDESDDEADDDHCFFDLNIYPSKQYYESTHSTKPIIYTVVVVVIFFLTSMVFVVYDCSVTRRQNKVMVSAQRSNAIVSSLFPAQVRDRLMKDGDQAADERGPAGMTMQAFHSQGTGDGDDDEHAALLRSRPIADLFPSATVMFADISGFTAWASVREPAQVFTLLEQIYNSFDVIARRRNIFKVETIGDCYVAVAGLPEPNPKHAEAMARFATECLTKMKRVVKKLEVILGPDTAELSMRFGLHSGPVTAGVLRGEKSRFQLFGDTVNTAARIESTGTSGKIHLSQETAELLIAAGKSDWIKPRDNLVTAKGKGTMQTFWLAITSSSSSNAHTQASLGGFDKRTDSNMTDSANGSGLQQDAEEGSTSSSDEKTDRLVDWHVDILQQQLMKVIAMRNSKATKAFKGSKDADLKVETKDGSFVLDEVKEVISLSNELGRYTQDYTTVELSPAVVEQLRDYVRSIASMYRMNSFHNFEHASHVTMSVVKLLSRIVAPNIQIEEDDIEAALHDKTYGITSDPLTQFAVVLSALVHDIDHPGIPNSQLTKEGTRLAELYRDKSVAEQNSVDLAWTLLMEGNFKNLRKTIYHSEVEFKRFRALLVNTVLATDIMDKELGSLRKARWNKAFNEEVVEDQITAYNRKATIVIEHIIQASDIAHTMQHWHIYRKWNSRLFEEMYKAYTEGRAERNPAQTWYEGEIGFFDFYIIPLAKKLKDCGVFGVSSDEYLNYAMQNRREWELHGEKVVAGMIESIRLKTSQNYHKPAIVGDGHGKSVNIDNLNLRQIPTEVSMVPMTELPVGLSVLFADGSDTTCFQFARSVAKIAPKWTVKFANSGAKAVQIATLPDAQFDLIFIDQYFVNDDSEVLGTDAVIGMRNKGIQARICGMSANDHENIFDDAGADSFMFKPLPQNPDALKQDMLRILNGGDEDDMI